VRTICLRHRASRYISVFVQCSLVVWFTVLPFSKAAILRGHGGVSPESGPTTLKQEAAERNGPTIAGKEKTSSSDKSDDRRIVRDQSDTQQRWETKVEPTRVLSLAESVRSLGYLETANKVLARKSTTEGADRELGPGTPMPTPSPGIGSGGNGPGGSFDVEPAERRQGHLKEFAVPQTY
jgi:hypothetical protein